jgi:lipid A 4'-phosphatase
MNRTALALALTCAVITGVLFGVFPDLDLRVTAWFYEAEHRFGLASNPLLNQFRDASMYFVALFLLPALVAALLKLVRPDRPLLIAGRAIVFLLLTVLIGPLLLTNVALKDNWSRPRPREVTQFGGSERFLPWWDPRGACNTNCSFVAGEASGAMWLVAPAALAPPQWRPLAYAGALAFTLVVSVLRIGFGGHFFSDVIFACVLTFLIVWLMHGFLYRWRTRPSDGAIESVLARLGWALRRPFGKI